MFYLAYLFSNADLFEIISKLPVAISSGVTDGGAGKQMPSPQAAQMWAPF